MDLNKIIKKLQEKNEILKEYIIETYEKTYIIDLQTMFEVMVMLSNEIDDLIQYLKEKKK